MNEMSQANPTVQGFGWIMLRSKDPAALAAFYKDTLQLPVLRSWPDGYMFWAGQYAVVEIGPLSREAEPQPVADLAQADMLPVYTVHSISGFKSLQAIETFEADYGQVSCFRDPDGNWFGLVEVLSAESVEHPKIRDDLSLPQTPFMLNRVLLRSENPDRQRAFYASLFGGDEDQTGSSIFIGANSFLDFSTGSPSRTEAKDRDKIQRAFIPRVYGFKAYGLKAEELNAPLINEMAFKGGWLNYHLDPEGQLFGFQERRPFDPDNQSTHCEEDQVARDALGLKTQIGF